jgi:tRNA uridine 5-carbamoylmethylation protein Kti12
MCGIPGSGKTTLSRQLAEKLGAILYCYDALPKKHVCEDVHQTMYKNIAKNIQHGNIVICDDLHLTIIERKQLINALHDVECVKVIHVMHTPLDVCIERNRNRKYNAGKLPDAALKYCYAKYEEPTLSEGWDEIIYHEYAKE